MPFIPHTDTEIGEMLAAIGAPSIDALFDEIPAALRIKSLAAIPDALSEMEVGRLMQARANQDGRPLNFLGAGAYEHHIPAAVWAIVTRGEFYSAYTPYQAEASQGTLQLLYEYQTMMSSLTGMEVSNASLYDGASALAEACLMAVRAHRKSKSARIVVPSTLNPTYLSVSRAVVEGQNLSFTVLPYEAGKGTLQFSKLEALKGEDLTAVVIQQPNFFGQMEDVDAITDWAHANNALVIAVVNPLSLALFKPPGEWGAKGVDIVVGDGQPFGVPLSSGGPYFGFMTTRMEHVRQMPGRIIGRTVDLDGKQGFTLTLQAREQHIRRSKATSNICTNQGLLVTAATIHMSLLGAAGLESVAATSQRQTTKLVEKLTRIPGVKVVFDGYRFHEAVLQLPTKVSDVLDALAKRNIVGGLDLSKLYPELGNALLVCATEMRTDADLDAYASALAAVLERKP
ncbi:putative glycine dehydrogenase (decarboxylating) subunit 1 [Steroidobacter agaridevorans]|uniref:Probable glycine dehydrogenase (decarboxylating) subunit 1 n=1 Tax=Steroidobacter agaridevorans TaxID=2695856 RepID=A0A829YJU1_9GAMM|nr:aminomethyl-transferring glycine dehydrogenase subunit GcvPA [Steroidobacter agaridevorans]GFE83103.1 putative glycine dehydrogenase (decarboxylating) subunit 1 [Steroidobacter agaridevorans]GFE86185.1 putative glycine dehydrogenase (decarboxylating) subunit 1 [Steroidobacter agaridevorans]